LYSAPNLPFPQGVDFEGCIKPEISQEQMNQDILEFYEKWKTGATIDEVNYPGYLFQYPGPLEGMYYINADATGEDEKPENWGKVGGTTQSEATGYGMIIFALMAGSDKDAQSYFNGLRDAGIDGAKEILDAIDKHGAVKLYEE